MRVSLAAVLCLLAAGCAWAGDHTVTLTRAQEAKLPLAAAHRQQTAAEVVQEAASRCVNIYIEQAEAADAALLVNKYQQVPLADRPAALTDVEKRIPAEGGR